MSPSCLVSFFPPFPANLYFHAQLTQSYHSAGVILLSTKFITSLSQLSAFWKQTLLSWPHSSADYYTTGCCITTFICNKNSSYFCMGITLLFLRCSCRLPQLQDFAGPTLRSSSCSLGGVQKGCCCWGKDALPVLVLGRQEEQPPKPCGCCAELCHGRVTLPLMGVAFCCLEWRSWSASPESLEVNWIKRCCLSPEAGLVLYRLNWVAAAFPCPPTCTSCSTVISFQAQHQGWCNYI